MKRKLIEVAIPLEAINRESAREKSIRHGHPSTLHLWWARRPLAACRAVLFASLVDDPSSLPEEFPTEEAQEKERERLFAIIERLVKWDNSNNEDVLDEARREILKSTDGDPPAVLDPFCGGGSIPLEAQRLGLKGQGSDLNPVAVLITKALVEIPPKFADVPPVNPAAQLTRTHAWKGAHGLADDVRFYGEWMRDQAESRIGHLYPKVRLVNGKAATVIAWLWARAVKCPNPACGVDAPLVRSFFLSTKNEKQAWVEPYVADRQMRFRVRVGTATNHAQVEAGAAFVSGGKKTKAKFRCMACETTAIDGAYVDNEANAGRMGALPYAVVADGDRSRVYLPFEDASQLKAVEAARVAALSSAVQRKIPGEPARGTFAGNAQGRIYGFKTFADYFTPRQLVALTTLSDLVGEARERVLVDAKAAMLDDGIGIADGGVGATAYADAVATYLAFGVDKNTLTNCTLATWQTNPDRLTQAFSRQAIAMTWDFAEANPLSEAGGGFVLTLQSLAEVLERLPIAKRPGEVRQLDATAAVSWGRSVIFTDPPYYDNIGYADLSDYFYVWQRRTLRSIWPDLTSTLLVPKAQELIASSYRHEGDAERARAFFEQGMTRFFGECKQIHDTRFPMNIVYAFKQSEGDSETGNASTGWETMLEGMVTAGFQIIGTWPIRSELVANLKKGVSALASSVVLTARVRPAAASIATRRELIGTLKRELPTSLKQLQQASIAPVDLAQAAIGPGMAIFSRYSKVVEADGSAMRVRSALQLINQALDEVLSEQESEYDADTQWAVAWFDQFGMKEASFGEAETLSKAKNTSVNGLVDAGFLRAAKGRVQLLSRDELSPEWNPAADARLTVWEVTQQLIRRLQKGGEAEAAELLRKVGGLGEVARDLAYRLYSVCERKGWTDDAIAYNSLVVAWPEIARMGGAAAAGEARNERLF